MFSVLNFKLENPFLKSALTGFVLGILLEFFLILLTFLIFLFFLIFFGATSYNSSSAIFLIAFYIIAIFLGSFTRLFFGFLVGFISSYFFKSFPQMKRILFSGISGTTNAIGAFVTDVTLILLVSVIYFIILAFTSLNSGGMGLQLFFMQAFLGLLGLVFYLVLLLIPLMIGIILGVILGCLGGLVSTLVFPSPLQETIKSANVSVSSFVMERSLKKK